MTDFYEEVLRELLQTGELHTGMRVLVVCAGTTDSSVLRRCGFTDVVLSNVGPPPKKLPHEWSQQDAEHLTFDDRSFDLCLVHSGLHHCHSPHRALLEMYRVARHGVLLFEPYDNLLTRVGVKLNIGQEYEHASVYCNHSHHGGVGNTDVPNFIYRFTEQEIVKAVHCYAPYAEHDIRFFHRMRIPWTQLKRRRNRYFYHAVRAGRPVLKLIETVLPRQSNNFAALIRKPDLTRKLHPWLQHDGDEVRLDQSWVHDRYGR
jgi:ubiquinone/menaquinone biosynthesis C-methylase UbiE